MCLSKEFGFYSGIKWNEEPLNALEEECDKYLVSGGLNQHCVLGGQHCLSRSILEKILYWVLSSTHPLRPRIP